MAETATARSGGVLATVRRAALWLLFAALLMLPKMLRLRRRAPAWNALRVAATLLGIAALAAGLARPTRVLEISAGVLLLAFALLIPPERAKRSVDQRARDLGALVVVDGGTYRDASGAAIPVRLFVGPEQLWLLDAALRILEEIPFAGIGTLRAEPAGQGWRLLLARENFATELHYGGPFAEHLARVAESTVRNQLRRELPILR